jgi:hypothetical protein
LASDATQRPHAIEELARSGGVVDGRVAYKRNAKGEHVVALIFSSFSRH